MRGITVREMKLVEPSPNERMVLMLMYAFVGTTLSRYHSWFRRPDPDGSSGRLQVDRANGTGGVLSGTFRDDIARGRDSGVFGEWTGQCPLEAFPDC